MGTFAQSSPVTVDFSTAGLPRHAALALFDQAVSRVIAVETIAADGASFAGRFAARSLGPLALIRSNASGPSRARRGALHIKSDPLPYYDIVCVSRGSIRFRSGGECADATSRQFTVTHPDCAFELEVASPGVDMICLRLPEWLLRERLPQPQRAPLAAYDAGAGLGRLAVQHLQATLAELERLPAAVSMPLAAQIAELFALAMTPAGCGDDCGGQSVHAALRLRIQRFMDARLADASLAPPAIASAHRISERYLHRVFEGSGTTVSAHLRRRRLERARQMLQDPRFRSRSVARIAEDTGFRRASQFSRAFRQAFGISPRAVRAP